MIKVTTCNHFHVFQHKTFRLPLELWTDKKQSNISHSFYHCWCLLFLPLKLNFHENWFINITVLVKSWKLTPTSPGTFFWTSDLSFWASELFHSLAHCLVSKKVSVKHCRDIYSGIELELAWSKVSTKVCGFTFRSICDLSRENVH